ncbi:hypothetical protein BDV95DRAFT_600349 [Massariosphaeria phaeospora]|uniref:Uncharacterized protein n=1 Tax=Massariosphaeria phaeospora TaxID=100035 RepID=A0A7C8M0Z6_9PLEO|nr:hypothetical protein BDV95DRAFT_600349 [Massariosphaeria phaeospora]
MRPRTRTRTPPLSALLPSTPPATPPPASAPFLAATVAAAASSKSTASSTAPSPVSLPGPPPLSPSAAPAAALEVLRACRRGARERELADWHRLPLSGDEYSTLKNTLAADASLGLWVADKLRYNYSAAEQTLTLRMPAPPHDVFASRLESLLSAKLLALLPANTAAQPGDDILPSSSPTQEQHPPVSRLHGLVSSLSSASTSTSALQTLDQKSPDGQFHYKGHAVPPLVIEVGNSQTSESLTDAATSWIQNTEARTRTVITVDIEYQAPDQRNKPAALRKARQASYSVYTFEILHEDGEDFSSITTRYEDVAFREADPTKPGHSRTAPGELMLNLSDFCPRDALLDDDPNPTITITHRELHRILREGEQVERDKDEAQTIVARPIPKEWKLGSKRKREQVPPSDEDSPEDDKRNPRRAKASDPHFKAHRRPSGVAHRPRTRSQST